MAGLMYRFGIPYKPQVSGIAYAGFQIAVTDDAPLSIDPLPTDFPVTAKSSLAFSGCHDFGGMMITGRTGAPDGFRPDSRFQTPEAT